MDHIWRVSSVLVGCERLLRHMRELELLVPFTLNVIVVTRNLPSRTLVTDVVKAGKTRARNVINTMVRDQKVLLPPHKNAILVTEVILEAVLVEDAYVGAKGREEPPVLAVNMLIRIPFSRQKMMLGTNDLRLKKRCELWKFFREPIDMQIATKRRFFQVDMLNVYPNIITVCSARLVPFKLGTRI